MGGTMRKSFAINWKRSWVRRESWCSEWWENQDGWSFGSGGNR